MSKIQYNFRFLIHNIVLHPIAGLFWFFGFIDTANKIHNAVE